MKKRLIKISVIIVAIAILSILIYNCLLYYIPVSFCDYIEYNGEKYYAAEDQSLKGTEYSKQEKIEVRLYKDNGTRIGRFQKFYASEYTYDEENGFLLFDSLTFTNNPELADGDILPQLKLNANETKAGEYINTLLHGFNDNSIESVRSVFSENVIASQSDFEGDIQELINFVEGEAKLNNDDISISFSDTEKNGKNISNGNACFYISTTEQSYVIELDICFEDELDAKNEGVRSLNIYTVDENTANPNKTDDIEGINIVIQD